MISLSFPREVFGLPTTLGGQVHGNPTRAPLGSLPGSLGIQFSLGCLFFLSRRRCSHGGSSFTRGTGPAGGLAKDILP